MAKRNKEPEKEMESAGMMRWLLTYADLITLLLAFFIIMYASSNVDQAKFQALSQAMSAAFGLTGNPALLNGGGTEGAKPIVFPASQLQLTELKNKLAKHILEQRLDPAINLHMNERGLLIRIYADKVRFEKGKAALSPEYKRLLDKIGEILPPPPMPSRSTATPMTSLSRRGMGSAATGSSRASGQSTPCATSSSGASLARGSALLAGLNTTPSLRTRMKCTAPSTGASISRCSRPPSSMR